MRRRTPRRGGVPWRHVVVVIAGLIPVELVFWRLLTDRLGANPIREAEIQTGLWTLRLLAVTLSVTPLRQSFGWNFLAKYRRTLGLLTFSYACVHLSMWVGVDWFFDWRAMGHEIAKHKYILVGMLTFTLLVPLAVTSTAGWVRRLGRNWVKLHRLIYVAAVTGTIHYLWAVKKDTAFPLAYLAVFVMLLAYRGIATRRRPARLATARASGAEVRA